MKTVRILVLLVVSNLNTFAQSLPDIKFNHLYFVIDKKDMMAIRPSDFIKNKLAPFEVRVTHGSNGVTWTGTYIYGSENYLELFDTTSIKGMVIGLTGLGLSVDHLSDLDKLDPVLKSTFNTDRSYQTRNLEDQEVPWYDGLTTHDPTIDSLSYLGVWVMAYRKEYFDYKKIKYERDALTPAAYLSEHQESAKGKFLKRFSGAVLRLNELEKTYFTGFFDRLALKKISANEYVTVDNFRFLIKNRLPISNKVVESIEFETVDGVSDQLKTISENVMITIVRGKGKIYFK